MARLTIDSRETKKTQELVKLAVPDSTVHALHSADFSFSDVSGNLVGVERKTVSDFLASISTRLSNGNQRLADQLERMAIDYNVRILLLEGFWQLGAEDKYVRVGHKESGFTVAAFQMALLSLQRKYTTRIIWTPDLRATAITIRALIDRAKIKEF